MSGETYNELCGQCRHIIDTIRVVGLHGGVIHHSSLDTLEASAEEACGICTVLLGHLQSSPFQQIPGLWDRLFPIRCESDTSSAIWQTSFELILTSKCWNLNLKFILEAIDDDFGKYSGKSTSFILFMQINGLTIVNRHRIYPSIVHTFSSELGLNRSVVETMH